MNILISGASRGIGYETTKELAHSGEHNIIILARDKSGLMKLSDECRGSKSNVIPFVFDLENDIYSTIAYKLSAFDGLDILINNAGLLIKKSFLELEPEEWEKMFKVNVFSIAEIIKTVLPFMGKSSKGHIVNISSMGGFQGSMKFHGMSAYSASKAALANLTECLAMELSNSNISVNCLAIGAVETEMFKTAFPGNKAPVSAKEMAKFISDFSLNAHNYLNGKIIPVSLSVP